MSRLLEIRNDIWQEHIRNDPEWEGVESDLPDNPDQLLVNGYDGAIHAAEGPHAPVTVYHTFNPSRITFIETLSV